MGGYIPTEIVDFLLILDLLAITVKLRNFTKIDIQTFKCLSFGDLHKIRA